VSREGPSAGLVNKPLHTGCASACGIQPVVGVGLGRVHRGAQLRLPSVSMAADSDEAAAVARRRRVFDVVATNRWWVGGAHLPFPGLGHVRRDPGRYTWVPVTFTPVD
jgi:hypothetical protein